MNNQYFAYTRVSTVKQGDGASLEAQKDAIERYAAQHGLPITQWFEEKETAAKQGRPVFTDMIKQLRSGKGSGVIMHKIDRSARNLRDWATVSDLQDERIDVRFAADSIDLSTRSGRLTASMLAVLAEDYVHNLKDEREKGFNARLKQGLYPLKAPAGYLDNGGGKAKTICQVKGPLIRELYELYATGEYSLETVADEMWQRGLRSRNGGKIYKSKIDRILRDPFYVGMIKIWSTGYLGQGIHEPLISQELYDRVQARRNGRTNRKATKLNLLFRRRLTCGMCKNFLIGERQRGHIYYRCHQRMCPEKTIREEVINDALASQLEAAQLSDEAVQRLRGKILEENLANASTSILMKNKAAISEIKQKKERLLNAYLSGRVNEQVYEAKNEDLMLQENGLHRNAIESVPLEQKQQFADKFLEHVKTVVSTYLLANQIEKRQLIELLFSSITVTKKSLCLQHKTGSKKPVMRVLFLMVGKKEPPIEATTV